MSNFLRSKIVLDALRQLTTQSTATKQEMPDISKKVSPVPTVMAPAVPTSSGEPLSVDVTETAQDDAGIFRTPLTVQTSPAPSNSSNTTDTASESGSAFNSPRPLHRPSSADLANVTYVKDFSRLVVVKMSAQSADASSSSKHISEEGAVLPPVLSGSDSETVVAVNSGDGQSLNQQQRFGPGDLTALLKSLEKEIESYEILLAEEMEKRKNYRVSPFYLIKVSHRCLGCSSFLLIKVDDGRRTHNYDEFICTFLSMLAEQGTLASLVEQNTIGRKRTHRFQAFTHFSSTEVNFVFYRLQEQPRNGISGQSSQKQKSGSLQASSLSFFSQLIIFAVLQNQYLHFLLYILTYSYEYKQNCH